MRCVIVPPRLVPASPHTKILKPGAFSSTPIFSARNARSWPSNSFTGSASAVVANGMVAGSHLHRSFSGGSPATNVMGLMAIVESAWSQAGYSSTGKMAGAWELYSQFPPSANDREPLPQITDAVQGEIGTLRHRHFWRGGRRHIFSGIH